MGFTQVWQPVAYKHSSNTLTLPWCGVSEHDHCLAVSLMETAQSDKNMPAKDAIRVCVVVSVHPSVYMGGAQYQAHLLASELARRNNVMVTYVGRIVPDAGAAMSLPYSVCRIGQNRGFRRRSVLFDVPDLWRALTQIRPHIIYQRMKQSYSGVCSQYARQHGVPFIFHVASDADLQILPSSRHLSVNLPLDIADVVIGNWGVRRATHIIVQSNTQGKRLGDVFRRTPSRVIRSFQPLRQELPGKSIGGTRVLWVGNFKDVKRPELFVRLAQHFRDRDELRFWMVGMPSTNRRFASLMLEIDKCSNLKYFGGLPLENVNVLMSQADILVSTSRYEGFPNTFIQAWSNGAVVVSLSVDIDDGLEAQGVGYCAGSVDRLNAIVAELARSTETRHAIAERSFKYVHKKHSMANATELTDFMLNVAGTAAAP
jgi:glycosyltransferase involved in cell wall biosynthesis